MKADDDQAEDIAGLFKKFGGDPHAYKEFEPCDGPERGTAAWPLVTPTPKSATPAASHLSAAASSVPPPTNVGALFSAPAPAPSSVPASAPTMSVLQSDGGRELDALFMRLLGAPVPQTPVGQGLLARWRSQP